MCYLLVNLWRYIISCFILSLLSSSLLLGLQFFKFLHLFYLQTDHWLNYYNSIYRATVLESERFRVQTPVVIFLLLLFRQQETFLFPRGSEENPSYRKLSPEHDPDRLRILRNNFQNVSVFGKKGRGIVERKYKQMN